MSHPLFFRGSTYFCPLGNASAFQLTQHLPPEQHANILVLGWGDPRHILYTVFTNQVNSSEIELQKLDVTCCDVQCAVLARNAILFSLLADQGATDRLDLIWNIFYHLVLDPESLSLLIEQCRKLVGLARDLHSWNAGPYAQFLTVCDKRTLAQLCRFWSLYLATADYTPDHRKWFQKNFLDGMKQAKDRQTDGLAITSSRSAGPLLPLAMAAIALQFRSFWSTGLTDDGLHSTVQATFVNPTFAFSSAGDEFSVHPGIDPVAGFHFAEVFASSHDATPALLAQKLVQAARKQFSHWCTSVVKLLETSMAPPMLVIRMYAGDALGLAQAFAHLNSCGATATPVLTSQWETSRIEFDENQYGEGASTPAPTMFNVIETSNTSDHVGLLNLLMVAVPVLSKSPSATLYTEALLPYGDAFPVGVLERLCGDMQTMSLLLGIIPSAFLSRFTTRSGLHETLFQPLKGLLCLELIAWRTVGNDHLLSFAPDQLGHFLFDVYRKMFSDENIARQLRITSPPSRDTTSLHYTRRSFVQLLDHIKSRVKTDWTRAMGKFDDGVIQDNTLILGSNLYQEMCCHLHLLDIMTFTSMEQSYIQSLRAKTVTTIFRDWESIPAVVTVVLVIPRSKITAVASELRRAGCPVFQCEIRTTTFWNIFMHISAAYGRLETAGTGQTKTATIVEEKEGVSNSSPLIVFFSVPSSSLLLSHNATAGFRIRPSPGMSPSRLHFEAIFTAPLEDSQKVHVLAEPPSPAARSVAKAQRTRESQHVPSVQLNESCTEVRSFAVRVNITNPTGQASLAAGSSVKLEQTPNHGARLSIDEYAETIDFPLPVNAANSKLRVARKSMYIEITVPLALSQQVKNERVVTKRFPAKLDGGVPTSWNIHRVNLDLCPEFKPLDIPDVTKWLVPHLSLMFSGRERAVRETGSPSLEDTFVNLKNSLHNLLLSAAGVQGPVRSVFKLQNTSTDEFLAVVFVSALRFDIASHTIIADVWLVPGTTTVQGKMNHLDKLDIVAIKIDLEESEAWRYLLPLFIERCRTWSHRPLCEYAMHGSIPLHPGAGADPEKIPYCSCGVGVGTETFPEQFKSLAPYATRMAVSPLFAVPYLEKVGIPLDMPTDKGCRACGKQGGSLSLCGKCKNVRYCSRECQVKHWKVHKKNCFRVG